jgi:inosine-uridine nucleoside N-ribohydrolase
MWRSLSLAAAFSCGWLAACCADEPFSKTPILLDCAVGTGIDDAFALALATADPAIELLGVTTVSGNTEDRAWMVCRFLSAIGKEKIPVAFGRGKQPPADLKGQFQYRYHPAVLFGRTAKPVKLTAVELLHERLSASESKTTIVCTGPLTNIAQLLADYPDAKEQIERIIVSADRNLADDVAAARGILASGVRIDLLPWEWGTSVRLEKQLKSIFARHTPLTLQLQTLHELDRGNSFYPDAAAAAMASADADLAGTFTLAPVKATINDNGKLTTAEGESPVRIVKSLKTEPLLDWMQKTLTQGEPALPREPGNRTTPVDRGGMPNRIHVFEDFETNIERRWWLAGIPAGSSELRGSSRHCRGMLTMDFDDQQGDTQTMYRAVIFNPVPGPPMGKHPRLSFRCWLKGTDKLRVQIYSLSNGYHRYLSLADLPQERWLDLAVDMTHARRPDGSGGPLSEGERIDDIQFYVDPRADLLIDDIVLYDAGAEDEPRDFPRRIHFTGWFDTGKQGQEWPGLFEIPAEGGFFGKAARSLPTRGKDQPSIRVDLRGSRPLTGRVQLDFRYRIDKAAPIEILLRDSGSLRELRTRLAEPTAGSWQQASVTLGQGISPGKAVAAAQELAQADELHFVLSGEGELWVDDLLIY